MKEKKKAASTAANLQYRSDHKDSKSSRIKQQIRKLFLEGGKYTSKDLNTLTGGNDSRKVISDLRKEAGTLKIFARTIIENYIGWARTNGKCLLIGEGMQNE